MHEAEVTCHTGNGTTAIDSRVGKEYWLVILEEDESVIQHQNCTPKFSTEPEANPVTVYWLSDIGRDAADRSGC